MPCCSSQQRVLLPPFRSLLAAFWRGHDPTAPTHLRPNTASAIFFSEVEQRDEAVRFIAEESEKKRGEVLTTVKPESVLWPAGPSHMLAHYVGKTF